MTLRRADLLLVCVVVVAVVVVMAATDVAATSRAPHAASVLVEDEEGDEEEDEEGPDADRATPPGRDDADTGTTEEDIEGTRDYPTVELDFSPEDVVEGRLLYATGCVSCHGVAALGTDIGPPLINAGAASVHFYLTSGRMPLDEPRQQTLRKPPAYTREEIFDLIAYITTLGDGPGIPVVDPDAGDLSEGFLTYIANCAGCHNAAGSGGALGNAIYAPGLLDATPTQVAEAVRIGPGAMPLFPAETLSAEQVNDLVRYVMHLQDPVDRGGAPLGRIGPIPEGFVAWLIGLGVMLIAAFWIGTRD